MSNGLSQKGYKTFIIAEAGVNHNGSLEIAKRLVDVAVESGADAVKFQTFKARTIRRKRPMLASHNWKCFENSNLTRMRTGYFLNIARNKRFNLCRLLSTLKVSTC